MGHRGTPSTSEDILAERHRGIRPGFGYPACPDHSEKFKLFDLLEARRVGIDLTEHAAMTPAASVSGLYFAHPAGALLHGRPAGRGSDRELRAPEGPVDRARRALADLATLGVRTAHCDPSSWLPDGKPYPDCHYRVTLCSISVQSDMDENERGVELRRHVAVFRPLF